MKHKLLVFSILTIIIGIGGEILLRYKFGFCDSPLCVSSDQYEYICAPSQHRYRFGNHVDYNSYSQRSEEPDTTKSIVLGLGDSVINGGVQTDQSEMATTLASNSKVQVLNISAGSWGPDNCAAYLKAYGLFDARMIMLVVSSHDAHDIMDFQPVVGLQKSFPSKQYKLAWGELIGRYLIDRYIDPLYKKKQLDPDQQALAGVGIHKKGKTFNPGFSQLKQMADSAHIPLVIYLHPDQSEMKEGQFNEQGKEILQWAQLNGVSLYDGFSEGENFSTYRDGIHLNQKGQFVLSHWMKRMIKEYQI